MGGAEDPGRGVVGGAGALRRRPPGRGRAAPGRRGLREAQGPPPPPRLQPRRVLPAGRRRDPAPRRAAAGWSRRGEGAVYLRRLAAEACPPPTPARRCGAGDDLAKNI